MADVFSILWLGKPLGLWLGFLVLVIGLLALDLGVFHRRPHDIDFKESLISSGFYVGLGLAFGAFVWWWLGAASGQQYLTGFVVEKSLAMDNIFVIAMIFARLGIPRIHQHRVLFWGILGVIVFRGVMIGLGAAMVQRFEWILYLFSAFLIYTGIKMWRMADAPLDLDQSPVLRFVRRRLRVTSELHGARFFVRRPAVAGGAASTLWATPLFLALVLVEVFDIIFAFDSIPAILAITTDPYLVYTSNVFAILGLRALYFALSALVHRFVYLKQALAALLVFIGSKILAADLLALPGGKVPPAVSLGVTLAILAAGIGASLWKARREARA